MKVKEVIIRAAVYAGRSDVAELAANDETEIAEADEAINVKVTKQPNDAVGMEKLKADIDGVEADESSDTGGTSNATENA